MNSTLRKTTGSASLPLGDLDYLSVKRINDFLDDFNFRRKHPFLKEWKEWQQMVKTYHSVAVDMMCKAINRGSWRNVPGHYVYCDLTETTARELNRLIDIRITEVMTLRNIRNGRVDDIEYSSMSPFTIFCDCTSLSDESECEHRHFHKVQNLIVALWTRFITKYHSKRNRKYFDRLQRIILSLHWDQLKDFDMALINNPPSFKGRGRKLFTQLYERGYLDKLNLKEMPFVFEFLKNFKVATQQCYSGDLPDKIIKIVKEQGFSHDINLSDNTVEKIQLLIKESQDNFVSSLSSTLLMTARQILVLFIMATTIGMLAKLVVGVGLGLLVKILNLIYSLLVPDNRNRNVIKQQSGELSIPLLPTLITKYVVNPPANIMAKVWKNPNFDLVMRRIGYVGDPKIHNGIDTITDWTKGLIFKVINWFRETILGIGPLEDLENMTCQLDMWNLECDEIVKSYFNKEIIWTDSTWSVIMSLYSRGISFTRNSVYTKYRSDIWRTVTKLGNLLEKFSQRMRSNTSVRNPPVTIYMCGDSGVGKSSVTYPFAVEILKGVFTREKSPIDLAKTWKNLIYMRSAEQEFWDGYENQLVTVFDDFNQLVDSSGSPNIELFEIIRASNCFPYPLHMAALDQKANTTFNSKIILASSNLQKPKTASLNFPTALFRRFDICVRVSRKEICHTNEFDPSLFEFQLYNMVDGKLGDFIGYKELVLMAVDCYFKRKGFVDSVDKYITESLKDYKSANQQGLSDCFFQMKDIMNGICPAIKSLIRSCKDFMDPVSLDNVFFSLKQNVEQIKKSTDSRKCWWDTFRKEHKYLVTAVAFAGIVGVCFAVVKTVVGFTREKSKEKMLTSSQFSRVLQESTLKVSQSESILTAKPGKAKVESIKEAKPGKAKVESIKESSPVKAKVESTLTTHVDMGKGVSSIRMKDQSSDVSAIQEGTLDVNACEILMKTVRNNMYKIKDCDSGLYIGHCLFIKGKVCIMPYHFLHTFESMVDCNPDNEIEFDGVLLSRSFRMKTFDLIDLAKPYDSPAEGEEIVISKDLMSVCIPSAIYHSSMLQHFVTRSAVQSVDNVKVNLPVLVTNDMKKSDRPIVMVRYTEGRSQLSTTNELLVTNSEDVPMRKLRTAWTYSMDTKSTECGAPLIVRNTLIIPGKICGLHVAGSDNLGEGFSTPVYQEDIINILSQYTFQPEIERKLKLEPVREQSVISKDLEFVRLGTLRNAIAQPSKTKIRKSLVWGEIREPQTRPCLLYEAEVEGEVFNPREYRIGKLGKPSVAIPQKVVNVAGEALEDFLMSTLTRGLGDETIKPVYSYAEAVQGIDGSPYVNSIKRSSSPGFPFVQMNGFKTKSQIYGSGEDFDVLTSESLLVEDRVKNIIECAKRGIALDHYFCDTLKDERKPIHKSHKTRLFSAGPLDYLLACKMYFNGIVALLEHNKNFCGISVGTNVFSRDWHNIANVLLNKSNKMVAGDFEGFDASQHLSLLEKCGEILINLSKRLLGSTDEDAQIMFVLLVSLFNSHHICGKDVYMWTHSLPSGHYLTAIINSIFVLLVFAIVWSLSHQNFDYYFVRLFFFECGIVAYGDDHIVSIPANRVSVFNQYRLPEYFKVIGLNYTLEDKDAKVTGFTRSLNEIQYLKRSFRIHKKRNQIVGPLSLDTILETPMWMHQCPDARLQTIDNLEWALRELSLHSKDKWDLYSPLLIRLLEKLNHFTLFKKYIEVQNLVLEN